MCDAVDEHRLTFVDALYGSAPLVKPLDDAAAVTFCLAKLKIVAALRVLRLLLSSSTS